MPGSVASEDIPDDIRKKSHQLEITSGEIAIVYHNKYSGITVKTWPAENGSWKVYEGSLPWLVANDVNREVHDPQFITFSDMIEPYVAVCDASTLKRIIRSPRDCINMREYLGLSRDLEIDGEAGVLVDDICIQDITGDDMPPITTYDELMAIRNDSAYTLINHVSYDMYMVNDRVVMFEGTFACNRFICNGCGDAITAKIYHCTSCFDYDLCATCYDKGIHDASHGFKQSMADDVGEGFSED